MKEEWLFPNAIVPVDVETTAALVAEIHRLIGVVGGMALAQPEQEPVFTYEQVKAHIQVAMMSTTTPPQRTWVGLTNDEKNDCLVSADPCEALAEPEARQLIEDVEQALKEKNCG
jgi:hypothetical protein